MREAEADRLIQQAATGARQLSADELQQLLEHVAEAGFDPDARETVRGRLAGLVWQGRTLRDPTDFRPVKSTIYGMWSSVRNGR